MDTVCMLSLIFLGLLSQGMLKGHTINYHKTHQIEYLPLKQVIVGENTNDLGSNFPLCSYTFK